MNLWLRSPIDRYSWRLSKTKMYKFLILFLGLASCSFAALAVNQPKQNIVRPCDLRHIQCIRENLAANSRCSPKAVGSIPSSYVIPEFKFEAPNFNASYIDRNLVIGNQDKCYVSEFFYNVKSSVAVLSVDCPGLMISSNRTLIQHTSYQEDTSYSFMSSWEYPLIRLTANMKHDAHIDLCNTFVFGDVAFMPHFKLTPNDQPTKNFLSYDLTLLNVYEREAFSYRAPQLFRKYINSIICNFGC